MNLPSESRASAAGSRIGEGMAVFCAPETIIAAFEFRSLSEEDLPGTQGPGQASRRLDGLRTASQAHSEEPLRDPTQEEAMLKSALDAARLQGLQQGEQQGRSAARSEGEARINAQVAQERERVVEALKQFHGVRERYFVEVEQEVVKLSLAIAARVLHREAQVDPLLLAGVVRVALEKMADRSSVVLRVAGADVAAWEGVFRAIEASERPRVLEDPRLERGACELESRMGTVELGVSVQLEEIEKGFFDLLNHRPVE
jgi:flagellar assembly protein FliH